MACLGKVRIKSKTGNPYRFKIFPLGTRFRKQSGIFLIACRANDGEGGHRHRVLYVGNSQDLSRPFESHHKAQEWAELGANCICVQSDQSETSRLDKERDLIDRFRPACNDGCGGRA